MTSLRHLQRVQPWTLAYGTEFDASAAANPMRRVSHDVLHVVKGLGRIAAECEYADHGKPGKLTTAEIADNLTDLVSCALHMATVLGIDLEAAVIANMERRNGVTIPPEVQP